MKPPTIPWLVLLVLAPSLEADPYFSANPYSPYPPGCATLPPAQAGLYGGNAVKVWSGDVQLDLVHKLHPTDPARNQGLARLDLYRVACAEPERSVILVEFRLPEEWVDPKYARLVLPTFAIEAPGYPDWYHYAPLELMPEPNSWGRRHEQQSFTKQAFGDYTGGWDNARHYVWRYILDVGPFGSYVGYSGVDLAGLYHRLRGLYLFTGDVWNDPPSLFIPLPAAAELLQPNPSMPLNGRLSGTWVEPGSSDQGFLLSFSNPVPSGGAPEDSELLAFLSWFTFDAQGNPVWLVGDGRFAQDSDVVSIDIVQLAEGEFLGAREARRAVVGSAHMRARNCNRIELEYELEGAGLGSGVMELQRLEALETAGYPCRDYDARLASLSATEDQANQP